MPHATPPPAPSGPRRRSLLAGALGVTTTTVLSGCSDDGGRDAEHGSGARKLRARSAADSAALVARYDATLKAHPSLDSRLRPLRAEAARHEAAFVSPGPAPSASSTDPGAPSPSASAPSASAPSASASPRRSAAAAPPVPADEKKALAALADAERRTADARAEALLEAPPELARLLASVAAAGAAHVLLLTGSG
ncbi:hypothetical protein ABT112_31800 [Streptomyces sp. NPDC002055]|uniref:hypothetical protein n=1 Tax=Streptomyces sp. NPDC002055 TaxID=3154534 RepID=UPI003325F3E0